MEREGASFVFTGEVLGQRPKSQKRDALRAIEKASGLLGRIVRPLSAKLLEPTIPELEGILDRSRLLDIHGRSRQRQIRLARELGIVEWPQPAGGCCYLTDESFSRKFFDILDARELAGEERRIRKEDIVLLSTGRHFRLSKAAKLVVGRSEGENAILDAYGEGRARLMARDLNGPVALVEGTPTWEERQLAARIVARYGKGRTLPRVEVEWSEDGVVEILSVEPEPDETRIESLRI
jgi:tRNA-specific 2-thiouridylase